jgi:hypothetical protein
MLTRRQWLQTNPRPKSPVNLQALLDQEQRTAAEQQDQARNLYNQITVANSALKTADSAALNRDLTALRARMSDTAKNVALLTSEIARAVKCPVHQLGLHYHRNRPEDLYICENGPHFLFWTRVDGKPQLIQVATLLLPGLDFPMTDAAKISRAEWLTQHVAQPGAFCKEHGESPLNYFGNRPDVLICEQGGEKYLWTSTPGGPGWVKLEGEPPSLETPID